MSRDILLGVIIGAQGLKGEVKVKTFTVNPEHLGAYGALHAKDGRTFRVRAARISKGDIAAVHLEGVADRNAAEALKGTELFVDRDALPPPDDEEYYHADLIGHAVYDSEDRLLGAVAGLHNFGAGDVIAIARSDGSDLLLPFTREIVPVVDIGEKRIVVAAPQESEEGEAEDWSNKE
jgi:16S rRNA processing protein RimM